MLAVAVLASPIICRGWEITRFEASWIPGSSSIVSPGRLDEIASRRDVNCWRYS